MIDKEDKEQISYSLLPIIELLENIDQLLNDGNIDDAQIEIALWLRTFYKLQAQQKESLL